MKTFRILTAELKKTKVSAAQPIPQDYFACTVTIDNTERRQQLMAICGTKVRVSQGGQSYRYAIIASDPAFEEVKQWLADKKAGEEYPFLIDGDVHEMETANTYYVINPSTGKNVMDSNSNPVVSDAITFFCPSGNSVTTQFRRISQLLKFVTVEPAQPAADVLA